MQSTELVYEYVLRITGTVEYGVNLQAIIGGKAAPPAEGARFDVLLEGSVDGPKVKGSVHGVDYINIRADGRSELHIHAQFDLTDGGKVSLFADGGRNSRQARNPPASGERDVKVQLSGPCLGELDSGVGDRDSQPSHRRGSGQGIQGLVTGRREEHGWLGQDSRGS